MQCMQVRREMCNIVFYNTPPQVLKLASLALPPLLPHPNIEMLPTPMSQAGILGTPFETQNYFTFIP